MSDMSWIRGFFGALVLAMAIAFSGLLPASPAFAQQIVVEGGRASTRQASNPISPEPIQLRFNAGWTT